MKSVLILLLTSLLQFGYGQVVLNADGPGQTYELITSVLAPGHNPIEVPDCNHVGFGEHIDEIFDDELGANVFRFYIHTDPDNDRCINFDRQRNEIKTYDQSPDNLLGIENEKVVYKWKFKLDAGFQSSPNFTHIHQLKSVGGAFESLPMYTLTTRKGNPDRLELRYAETDNQITLKQTDLAPFLGTWVEVIETIEYGIAGTYEIEMKRFSDDLLLFAYSNKSIANWRPNAEFVRPKWGIYRSLINVQDLRDEAVLFANFGVEEIEITNSSEETIDDLSIFPNPVRETIFVNNLSDKINLLQLFNLNGNEVLSKMSYSNSKINIDVSSLPNGAYVLTLNGEKFNQSKVVIISH